MEITSICVNNKLVDYIADIKELTFCGHLTNMLYEKKLESVTITEEEWEEFHLNSSDISGLSNKYAKVGMFTLEKISDEETGKVKYIYTHPETAKIEFEESVIKTPYLQFDEAFEQYVEGILPKEELMRLHPGVVLENDLHWAIPRQYMNTFIVPDDQTEEDANFKSGLTMFLGLICYRTDLGKKTCYISADELSALGINLKNHILITSELMSQDIISMKLTADKNNAFEYTLKKYCSSKPVESLLV